MGVYPTRLAVAIWDMISRGAAPAEQESADMVSRKNLHCAEVRRLVAVIAKSSENGRLNVVGCLSAKTCDKSHFCRFVNPLTLRVPLSAAPELAEALDAQSAS